MGYVILSQKHQKFVTFWSFFKIAKNEFKNVRIRFTIHIDSEKLMNLFETKRGWLPYYLLENHFFNHFVNNFSEL